MKNSRNEELSGDYEVRYWATEQSYKNGYVDGYKAAFRCLLAQLKDDDAVSEDRKKELFEELIANCQE